MEQAVGARREADERTEVDRLDDGRLVALADLGQRRVRDRVDAVTCGRRLLGARRVDLDDPATALLVDIDLGARLFDELLDDLAARTDDLTDLVLRDVDDLDTRSVPGDLGTRLSERLVHDAEDLEPCVTRLEQRVGQDLRRDTGELRVELQGRDEALGTRDLEVHVAVEVLDALDVGEGRVLPLLEHQAHRDARDRRVRRHAAVHEREGGRADRTHRRRAVRAHDVGHHAHRVRPVLGAREHRDDRTLGEQTVTDLTTLRRADATGLAGRVRRHVVVVHEQLLVLGVEGVEPLALARRAEREDGQHLRVAAREQRGAVRQREESHLGGDRTQVLGATTVDTEVLGHDQATHDLLLERAEGLTGLAGERTLVDTVDAVGEHTVDDRAADLGQLLVAQLLAERGVAVDGLDVLGSSRGDRVEDRRCVVDEQLELTGVTHASEVDEALLRLAQLADERLGLLDGVADDLLGRGGRAHLDVQHGVRGRLGLDHEDGDLAGVLDATGDDHVEHGLLSELLEGRERDPRTVTQHRVADRGDRPVERDAGHHRRERRAVHGDDVVGVELCGLQDGVDDLDLVAQTLGERRPERTVGEAAGEDGVLGRAALTLEERAGDAAVRVHALLDLDREREEAE